MGLSRSVLLRASRSRWLAERFMRQRFARRAVRRFMPGEELSDALGASRALAEQRIGVIITRLGETLAGAVDTAEVRDHYLAAFDEIEKEGLPVVISIKPTQLGLDQSLEACLANLETLAERATRTHSQLWIDMEDSSYVDRTLDLYRRLKEKHEPVGLAMQAYLRRTPADLESLMYLRPMIRLVKGAYAEPPEVAFASRKQVDEAYHALGERMLDAASRGEAMPIFGTHDMSIVNRLLARAGELGLANDAYEVHMLYGVRSSEQRRLAREGRVVRCLISYGSQWFPWYMRRLAERPANVLFVMRSAFMR